MQGVPASVFNLYTYIFAAIVLFAFYMLYKADSSSEGSTRRYLPIMYVYILIMAVCLFGNSFFKTLAATKLDAVALYPLHQGGSMMLGTAMSAFFFKEKVTPKSITGTAITFFGLLIINLL